MGFFSFCYGLLVVVVVDVCATLVFFLDVFIIILMSYLYYFNQIAKIIDPDVGCEDVK